MKNLEITPENISLYDDELVSSDDITTEIILDIKKSYSEKSAIGSQLIKLKNIDVPFNASRFFPLESYVFKGLKYRVLAVYDMDNNIIHILNNVVFCATRNKETDIMELNESSIHIITNLD